MSPGEVALGEITWALIRGQLYAIGFLGVMWALGLVGSPWMIMALPFCALIGLAFASMGFAVTTFMRGFSDFEFVPTATMPMFLFSTTFFPISSYGSWAWVVQLSPLYHGVALVRAANLGVFTLACVGHVLVLLALAAVGMTVAARRLGTLLLSWAEVLRRRRGRRNRWERRLRTDHQSGEVVARQRPALEFPVARRPLLRNPVDRDRDLRDPGDLRGGQHDLGHAVDECFTIELLQLVGHVHDQHLSVRPGIDQPRPVGDGRSDEILQLQLVRPLEQRPQRVGGCVADVPGHGPQGPRLTADFRRKEIDLAGSGGGAGVLFGIRPQVPPVAAWDVTGNPFGVDATRREYHCQHGDGFGRVPPP